MATNEGARFPRGRAIFDEPSRRATIGDQLRRHAVNQPNRLAIAYFSEHGDEIERLTYAELNERVNRIANSLAGLGVERGDVIGVMSRNSHHYVAVYLAAAKLGAVTTGINHNFRPAEMDYQLRHAAPRARGRAGPRRATGGARRRRPRIRGDQDLGAVGRRPG